MKHKVLSVLLIVPFSLAMADSPLANPIRPNTYNCKFSDGSVNYSTTSFIGKSQFHVAYNNREPLTKMGDEIREIRTPIGNLISIESMIVYDAYLETTTMVIPDIYLKDSHDRFEFQTQVVRTRQKAPFPGPSVMIGLGTANEFMTGDCLASLLTY